MASTQRIATRAPAPAAHVFPVAGGWAEAAGTRTGSRRRWNEDRWLVVPAQGRRPALLAVADGVGGEAAGERASAAAVEALEAAWRAWTPPQPPDALAVVQHLRQAARLADEGVRHLTRSDPRFARAATTLTAAVVMPDHFVVIHAGDSRAYALSRGQATLLTHDHTWVAEELAAGRLDAAEAARHPMRHVITRCLGPLERCGFDVVVAPHPPSGGLLLCTDGLSNVVDGAALAPGVPARSVPARRGNDPAREGAASSVPGVEQVVVAHVERLLAYVAAAQGGDDATVVLALPAASLDDVASDPFGLRRMLGRRRPIVAGGVAAGAVAVATAFVAGAWAAPRAVRGVQSLFRLPPLPVAAAYLETWGAGKLETLHNMLSRGAQRRYDRDAFVSRHEAVAAEMTLTSLSTRLVAEEPVTEPRPGEAVAHFDVTYLTARFGELRRRNRLPLIWEDGAWRVAWSPAVLLPELAGGRELRAFSDPAVRGAILDRSGRPLAQPAGAGPGGARRYPAGDIAGSLVGYTGEVTAEEIKQHAGRGYLPGDIVGKAGVEAAAEPLLGGRRGARLTLLAPTGDLASTLSAVPPQAGENVTLTLDLDLQQEVEALLGSRPGSVVVLDPTDGAVRALATYPRYDPNAFATGQGISAILNDPGRPLVHRPLQGLYPPGSIFKVISMGAALESGAFRPDSEFTCTGRWTGLPGVSQECWLKTGHGRIDLVTGLTQSCDVVFYEVGKRLDELSADLLPEQARRCGLGTPAGVLAGIEPGGIVPGPAWKLQALREPWTRGDAVNLSIGQGYLLVTPVQMAALYGAIAAGGHLSGPRLLDRAALPGGNIERLLPPPRELRLPWGAATLDPIRSALNAVVGAPNGTAASVFQGSPLAGITAGKTGTAETAPGREPHAWFCCYAPIEAPRVVVVAMLEYGGEGSRVAAPLARRVLETALRH